MTEKNKPEEHVKKHALTPEMEAKKWQPGHSGNPGGKVAGRSITAELRKLIDKGTNAEDTAQTLYDIACKGSRAQMDALKELLNRTDGKVTEKHLIAGVTISPELLEQAQKRLSASQNDTQELIEKYNATEG